METKQPYLFIVKTSGLVKKAEIREYLGLQAILGKFFFFFMVKEKFIFGAICSFSRNKKPLVS